MTTEEPERMASGTPSGRSPGLLVASQQVPENVAQPVEVPYGASVGFRRAPSTPAAEMTYPPPAAGPSPPALSSHPANAVRMATSQHGAPPRPMSPLPQSLPQEEHQVPPELQIDQRTRGVFGPPDDFAQDVARHFPRGKPNLMASPEKIMLYIGVAVLALILIMPIWDAIRLLCDPIYRYFIGIQLPLLTILVCVLTIIGYVVGVRMFFAHANPETHTVQSVTMLMVIAVTALGSGLTMIAMPASTLTQTNYDNVVNNCNSSSNMKGLAAYASNLTSVRLTSSCKSEYSVETCSGFSKEEPYYSFLKVLESHYRCSGFCVSRNTSAGDSSKLFQVSQEATIGAQMEPAMYGEYDDIMAVKPETPTPGPGFASGVPGRSLATILREMSAKSRTGKGESGLSLLELNSYIKVHDSVAPGRQPVIENPSLFSPVGLEASCDGMVMRVLKYRGQKAASALYINGLVFLFIAIVGGIAKVVADTLQRGNKNPREANKNRRAYNTFGL